jgi:hypothetical protein
LETQFIFTAVLVQDYYLGDTEKQGIAHALKKHHAEQLFYKQQHAVGSCVPPACHAGAVLFGTLKSAAHVQKHL